jgi:YVTN family beta-propeller protein
VADIKVGKAPRQIAVDSANNRAYVANHADVTVSVIDTTSNKVIDTIKLAPLTDSSYSGNAWGVALN